MMDVARSRVTVGLAAVSLALMVADAGIAHGDDLWGVRDLGIGRDLGAVRSRLERAPQRAKYDLDVARRRLWPSQIGAPLDPEAARLEREITQDEWRADRVLRRRALAASLTRLEAGPERLPTPAFLRPPYATDLHGRELPIGVGKQIILLQKSLRRSEAQLRLGRRAAATRHLADAETTLAALQATPGDAVPADDPQLVAARRQIALLKERIGDPAPPG
jgi:hypothetical protein